MEDLSVTLIQSTLLWEDIAGNLAQLEQKITAIQHPGHLILLPEMFSTGFSMDAARLAEEMDGSAVQWMQKMAQLKNCVIAGSLMLKDADKYHNRLIWMRPDGSYEYYDKRHLFGLGEEDKTYTAGKNKLIVDLKGWKICPMICYDLRFPVWSRNTATNLYDVLIYTANWPQKRIHHWESLLPARAVENQAYVIGLNRWGADGNEVYHDGKSMVTDMDATILWKAADEECMKTITFSADNLALKRRQFPFLKDADAFTL